MTAVVSTPEDLEPIQQDVALLKTAAQNGKAALQQLDGRVTSLEENAGGGTGSGYVGMPYVVITEPTDAAVKAGIKEWLDSRSNGFPTKKLVFAFIGTANLTTPLLPSGTGQIQGARWEGMSKRGTVLSWGSASTPMLTSKGQLRNWEFKDFTLNSRVASGKGVYLWSSVNSPGNNQDGTFDRIEFTGSWDYGIGLDGDAKSNLNSELTLRQLACSNSTTFETALFWSGMSPEFDQQDQFLNYHFEDPKFEGHHGTYIRLDKGGNVSFDGFGSWMHVDNDNDIPDDADPSPMILIPEGSHFDSTMFMHINRQRVELRRPWSKFLDAGWTGRGRITATSLDTTSKAYLATTPAKVQEIITLRNGLTMTFRESGFGGYVGLRGSKGANVVMEDCYSAMPDGADVDMVLTGMNGNGIVRKESAGTLKFR